jgi:hypothetical protein
MVRTTTLGVSFLFFAMAMLALCAPQDSPPPKLEMDAFFSGTVVTVAVDKLTVARTILGKPAEKRDFLINGETKVEGKLKTKSRVTVRFVSSDQGDLAVSIIVRDKTEKKK